MTVVTITPYLSFCWIPLFSEFMSQDFVVYSVVAFLLVALKKKNPLQKFCSCFFASCLFKKILSRSFTDLFSNKISASVEISVCYSFRVFYFQQNYVLHVISAFFLFSLFYRNIFFFHLAQCGNLLLLPKRISPSPMSCYYYDWIKLKAGILELAVKFAVSAPNLKRILCPQSVSVVLLGLIKKKNHFFYRP